MIEVRSNRKIGDIIIHRQIDNDCKFKSGDGQTSVKLCKIHGVHGVAPPIGDGEDGADPGEVGYLSAGGGHGQVRHNRQEDLVPPTPTVGEPKGAETVPVPTMGNSRWQKSPYEMAQIKQQQQQLETKIQIQMYITTQVANWLLTKRFWSNQAGDLGSGRDDTGHGGGGVDGAGLAEVGHGADVGDLVDGAHQLVVGGRGRGRGLVQLKNWRFGYIYR